MKNLIVVKPLSCFSQIERSKFYASLLLTLLVGAPIGALYWSILPELGFVISMLFGLCFIIISSLYYTEEEILNILQAEKRYKEMIQDYQNHFKMEDKK